MGLLVVFRKHQFWKIDTPSGKWDRLGKPGWAPISSMCSMNGMIYLVENNTLFELHPETTEWRIIGRRFDYKQTTAMCAIDGFLYVVSEAQLWRVDVETAKIWNLGGAYDWPGEEVWLLPSGDDLIIIHSDRLWRTDPLTGKWTKMSRDYAWAYTHHACSDGKRLFAVCRGMLLEIRPEDGRQRLVTDVPVIGPATLAANEDGLFMIHRLDLFHVDPDSPEITRLSSGRQWDQTSHMIALVPPPEQSQAPA